VALMSITAVPMDLREANEFVANFHRHNKPVPGARFSIGASDGKQLVGVAIVGRPVARRLQQQGGGVAEVVRCCVKNNAPKGACSFLYAACWRAWRAMGGTRLITYTLQTESGASLRGAGWVVVAQLPASDPARWQSRPGREWQPVVGQAKIRWEIAS
jgi:hypothetical protein